MKKFCTINTDNDYTCFSYNQIKQIVRLYNKTTEEKINLNLPMNEMYNALLSKIDKCKGKGDICLIEQCFIRANSKIYKELEKNLMPVRPSGKYDWLSTTDIKEYMERLMIKYPDFYSIGPVPIDFADPNVGCFKINTELECLGSLNLNRFYKIGFRKIGIVFNTDPSYKDGQHWIASFIDLNKKEINFWDSYGKNPPREILELFNTLQKYAIKIPGNPIDRFIININNVRHQYAGSECGVYCMYFITQSVKNIPFNRIINKVIKDEEMNQMREIYFRTPFTGGDDCTWVT